MLYLPGSILEILTHLFPCSLCARKIMFSSSFESLSLVIPEFTCCFHLYCNLWCLPLFALLWGSVWMTIGIQFTCYCLPINILSFHCLQQYLVFLCKFKQIHYTSSVHALFELIDTDSGSFFLISSFCKIASSLFLFIYYVNLDLL